MLETGDVVLVQARGLLHGQRTINNFWYLCETAAPSVPDASVGIDMATEWDALNSDDYTAGLSNELEELRVRAQLLKPNLTPTPIRFAYAEIGMSFGTGQIASSSLPSSCAAVVKRRGALASRESRGRVFLPGIPATAELDSRLTAAEVTLLEATVGAVVLRSIAYGGNNFVPVLIDAPLLSTAQLLVASEVSNILRVQRRREIGVGE